MDFAEALNQLIGVRPVADHKVSRIVLLEDNHEMQRLSCPVAVDPWQPDLFEELS